MRKQELYIFIAVIILVALIFFSYVIFSFLSISPSQPSPSPVSTTPRISPQPTRVLDFSPSPVSTPIPQPSSSPSALLTIEELINTLPIRTPLFNIEYYAQDELFRVTIKEAPFQTNQLQAQQWFRDRGVNPETLNIYWDAFPHIQR